MISVQNLCKRYGRIAAVDDVSFAVARGEVLGFLGPNGAGKSTTMRMLTGFIRPDRGTVKIGQYDIGRQPIPAKSMMGYLPESAPSYGDMTVQHFLSFIAAIRNQERRTVEHAIETCALEPVRRQVIDTLSKGYRHRVCFAQAILHDPDVLVLDEPTDGLDPNQKHDIRQLIRSMGERKAIILSTHILEEVDAVCNRVIIIDRGRIVANGLPDELVAESKLAGTVVATIPGRRYGDVTERLGKLAGVDRVVCIDDGEKSCRVRLFPAGRKQAEALSPRVFAACTEAGWQLSELYRERGRLDEVFRHITTSDARLGPERPAETAKTGEDAPPEAREGDAA